MRVHHNASSDAKRVAEHDVCSLPRDASELEKVINLGRNFASVLLAEDGAGRMNRLGFGAEKSDRSDVWLDQRWSCAREIRSDGKRLEERGSCAIDRNVGALGTQDCREKKLQRRLGVKFTACIGVLSAECVEQFRSAFFRNSALLWKREGNDRFRAMRFRGDRCRVCWLPCHGES